ncbi:phage protein [Paenibacillus caui]|uniref:phage protein n=1 Tax=Paenibacillus caui TaxID=2873927 RepID=UPI001CA92C5A|nr:hypothetical protein [Paenibacillus caui]
MNNFGRVAEVVTGHMKFSMKDFNIEASVPFDADALPNESEIKIWNLSDQTVNRLKAGQPLILNAGYEGDIGLVLQGQISNVRTAWDGVDKITTIYVLDSEDFSKKKAIDIAFAKGTYASSILRQLAAKANLPVALIELYKDIRYENGYSASGKIMEIIGKVAGDCQTRAYINKAKLYIRNLRKGPANVFRLNVNTGLIGTPESFVEEGVKGYNLKQQLQYRVTTASAIDLDSSVYQGRLYVRSGTHRISRSGDFTTESEAIV